MAKGKQGTDVDIDTENEFQRYPLIFKKTRMNSCTNPQIESSKSMLLWFINSR